MTSYIKKVLLILVSVELSPIFGIQVPTYPLAYSDKYSPHVKQTRQVSGYRVPPTKFKKPVNIASPFRQEINFNSPTPFSDAIRIVDPPSFFQEQKKYHQKPFVDGNHSKRPTSSAWKQQNIKAPEYRSPPGPKQKKVAQQHSEYRPGYRPLPSSSKQQELSYNTPGYRPPKYHTSFQDIQQYRPTIQYSGQRQQATKHADYRPTPPPTPPKESIPTPQDAEYQPPDNDAHYVTSYHSVDIEHPKPTATYLGIQTPNSESIRAQLQNLKERQKGYFVDEKDEFPTREKKPLKKKHKKPTENRPVSFGHDIYKEEKDHFQKLKDDHFGVKVHAATEVTTAPDDSKNDKPPFIPYRMLASVRHTNRITHKPRNPSDPRAKARFRTEQAYTVHTEQAFEENKYDHGDENRTIDRKKKIRNRRNSPEHLKSQSVNLARAKRSPSPPKPKEHISIKKIQTVYSEQGYEDQEYDHGDELRHADYEKKYRPRRSTNPDSSIELVEQVEELPVALSLVGPDGNKLTGDRLIKHITQLLKNSSKYLEEDPSESNANVASVIIPPEQFEGLLKKSSTGENLPQFSYQHLDTSIVPEGSAIKYAEKFRDFNESPYRKGESLDCDEGDYNFEQNSRKKKLGNLDTQLDCFKDKFFGRNPFSNPIFQEDVIPPNYSLLKSEVQNPSSLVYDDVMKTIKNSLRSEKHLALIPVPENAAQTSLVDTRKFESYSKPSTVAPRMVYKEIYNSLPVFDITKYFPKVYMIRPNGKIYSIKFRPKQPQAPVINQNAQFKRNNRQNSSRSDKVKAETNREPLPKTRVIEPAIVYKFSPDDAVRRPRGQRRYRPPTQQ